MHAESAVPSPITSDDAALSRNQRWPQPARPLTPVASLAAPRMSLTAQTKDKKKIHRDLYFQASCGLCWGVVVAALECAQRSETGATGCVSPSFVPACTSATTQVTKRRRKTSNRAGDKEYLDNKHDKATAKRECAFVGTVDAACPWVSWIGATGRMTHVRADRKVDTSLYRAPVRPRPAHLRLIRLSDCSLHVCRAPRSRVYLRISYSGVIWLVSHACL